MPKPVNLKEWLGRFEVSENEAGSPFAKASTVFYRCIPRAQDLKTRNGERGSIFWVGVLDGVPVFHAYYISPTSSLRDRALNQADNGYEGYPPLTVGQVIKNGEVWG